jgi:hypothetical protein
MDFKRMPGNLRTLLCILGAILMVDVQPRVSASA